MIEIGCEYLSVRCILLYVIIMWSTSFDVNRHSVVCLNVKEVLARTRHHFWSLSDNNKIQTENHLVRKWTLNHLSKQAKWLSCVVSTYPYGAFECVLLSCQMRHIRVKPHSIVCLNAKELLARSRRIIWTLTDSNKIRTHKHVVP